MNVNRIKKKKKIKIVLMNKIKIRKRVLILMKFQKIIIIMNILITSIQIVNNMIKFFHQKVKEILTKVWM